MKIIVFPKGVRFVTNLYTLQLFLYLHQDLEKPSIY